MKYGDEITKALPHVIRLGRRFGIQHDDAYDIGMDAMLRASEKFDPTRGFKFSAYAQRAVINSFIKFNKRRRTTELPEDLVAPVEQFTDERLKGIEKEIGKDAYLLLTMYYGCGFTYREIGELMGVKRTMAFYYVKRAINAARGTS